MTRYAWPTSGKRVHVRGEERTLMTLAGVLALRPALCGRAYCQRTDAPEADVREHLCRWCARLVERGTPPTKSR